MIPVDAAQSSGSTLGPPLPFLEILDLLLCRAAFLFLPCSRFRVWIGRVWVQRVSFPYFLPWRALVRFVSMGKMSAGAIPGFP